MSVRLLVVSEYRSLTLCRFVRRSLLGNSQNLHSYSPSISYCMHGNVKHIIVWASLSKQCGAFHRHNVREVRGRLLEPPFWPPKDFTIDSKVIIYDSIYTAYKCPTVWKWSTSLAAMGENHCRPNCPVESPAVQEVIRCNTILFAPEVKFPVQ